MFPYLSQQDAVGTFEKLYEPMATCGNLIVIACQFWLAMSILGVVLITLGSIRNSRRILRWSSIVNPNNPEEGNTMGNTTNNSRIWLLSTILGVFNYLFTGRGRKITNKNFNQDIVTIRGHIVWSWMIAESIVSAGKNAVLGSASYLWDKAKARGSVIQSNWQDAKSWCALRKIAFDSWMEELTQAKAKAKAEKAQVRVEEIKEEILAEPKLSLRSRIFGPSKLDIIIELLKETNGKLDTLNEVVRDLDPTLVPEPKMMHQDVLDADPQVTEILEDEPRVFIELPSITMENAERVIEESRLVEADTEIVDSVDDKVEATSVVVEEEPEMVAELVGIEKEKEEIRLQVDAHYQAVAEKYYMYDFESQTVDAECGEEGNTAGLPVGVKKLREMVESDESLTFLVSEADPEWNKKNWATLRKLLLDVRVEAIEKYTAS